MLPDIGGRFGLLLVVCKAIRWCRKHDMQRRFPLSNEGEPLSTSEVIKGEPLSMRGSPFLKWTLIEMLIVCITCSPKIFLRCCHTFSKFHLTKLPRPLCTRDFRNLYRGWAWLPFTSILSNMSNSAPKEAANCFISWAVPGSCSNERDALS